MNQALPIEFKEVLQLSNYGIDPSLCKINTMAFESDKYICAREVQNDGNSSNIVIMELEKNFNVYKKTIKAEAAIMHPTQNIIALRAKNDKGAIIIQAYNLDTKDKLKDIIINYDIVFWKWLSDSKIGIVTTSSVLVLSIDNPQEQAKKIFDRGGSLANQNVFILSMNSDVANSWYVLAGISSSKEGDKIIVNGHIQLFNVSVNQSQFIEGFVPTFGNAIVYDDNSTSSLLAFIEKKSSEQKYNLLITEISQTKKFKAMAEVQMVSDAPNDFPVVLHIIDKYGMVFLITNTGVLYVYEITSGALVFRSKISEDPCLFSAKNSKTGGIYVINKKGKLLQINVDEKNLINFIMTFCKHISNAGELTFKLASRYSLPGADKIFVGLFKQQFQSGNWAESAKIARDAPGNVLRNAETLNLFKSAVAQPGSNQPILIYFQTIMEKGKLNALESVEICKPLVMQGKIQVIQQWFSSGKFECSEELSEIVKTVDQGLALKMLLASGSPSAHGKVIEGLCSTGQFDKILPYCQQNNYKPDYVTLLRNIVVISPEAALGLANMICNRQTQNYSVDVGTVVDIFMARKRLPEATKFLMEYLKENRAEDSFLQTKLLEMNLLDTPKVALAILQSNMFSYYDKFRIANLCEKCGLLQVSLENYTDMNDIKRVILNTHLIQPQYLTEYFGRLSPENTLICLHELMKHNQMQNFQIVVDVAVKYNQKIPTTELVKLFETYGNFQGLFMFLSRVVNTINDPESMYKYICCAVMVNQLNEVERVIKEYDSYDPVKVKDFFLEKKLVNPRPLIILCDKHNYIEDLTKYLYRSKNQKFLENYLFQARPQNTPIVCATLLDEDCDENYIKQILVTVRGTCPIEPLVEEFSKRHKVKILQKFLEEREQEGNVTPALHNALAMIYIDLNNNPQNYLLTNKYYDSKAVGKYCEERDPHLAYIAYRRAMPQCDDELIDLTNKNFLYRLQAQYLVESLSEILWKKVLDTENPHRKQVIDQVISVVLPITRNPDEVSVTVRAFIDAGLQSELLELLEKIVLHNNEFSRNKSLQNLLILTAITADSKRVKGLLTKLDSYEGSELALKCIEAGLFEEAYFIYDKMKEYSSAVEVILEHMDDLKKATIYAEKINIPDVWSKLGRKKLKSEVIEEAIEAFLKANDSEMYVDVIFISEKYQKFEELIRYLYMVRQFKKDKLIDGELAYALSKSGKLSELESFLSNTNIAELGNVADRLYEERLYEPAKILYEHVGNNSRLASCLVYLKQYQSAITAAKKANNPRCWKEVCFACVKAGEFRLAGVAGSNIIIHPDHVEELVKEYEKWGSYGELILLFEANLGTDRNHIVTELGILYAKYAEEKLMDHCRTYFEKVNIPKLIRVCEQYQQWNEVVFLYNHYNGFDNALMVIMEHSPVAWKHDLFCQTLVKVTNTNLYYEAIRFYIDEQPQLINDMLKIITNKLDLSQTVYELRKTGYLPLALNFLKSVQSQNNYDVNEALNEIFVEDEDSQSLKSSILEYSSFDQLSLAKKIENHPLLEFRRISALVYRKNKKYQQSIDISKKLEYYKDAIETALESTSPEICEELLRFFASEIQDKECFCACLYTCYEYIKPDVAMELAWRYNFFEFLMPYMIQTTKDLTSKIDYMQKKAEDKEKKEEKEKQERNEQPLSIDMLGMGQMTSLVVYGAGIPGGMNPGMQGGLNPGMQGGMNPGMNYGMNSGGMYQGGMGAQGMNMQGGDLYGMGGQNFGNNMQGNFGFK